MVEAQVEAEAMKEDMVEVVVGFAAGSQQKSHNNLVMWGNLGRVKTSQAAGETFASRMTCQMMR